MSAAGVRRHPLHMSALGREVTFVPPTSPTMVGTSPVGTSLRLASTPPQPGRPSLRRVRNSRWPRRTPPSWPVGMRSGPPKPQGRGRQLAPDATAVYLAMGCRAYRGRRDPRLRLSRSQGVGASGIAERSA